MIAQRPQSSVQVAVVSNGVPVRNIWHMLLYAWKELRLLDHLRVDVESAPTLDGLFAKILSSLLRQRMRIGLGRNYRSYEQMLSGIRGRIDFGISFRRLAFPNARAYCHFQTFSPNVLKNQIIRSTVHRLSQRGDFGKDQTVARTLRQELRRLVRDLDHVELIELTPDLVRRQELERDDPDYRLMLAICHLILQREMPTETKGSRKLHGIDRDWEFVWQVFEAFVANFFELRLPDWKIKTHKTFYWPSDSESELLPVMKPDIVMQQIRTRQLVVVDTKFTGKSLTRGRFGNLSFNRDHLYQLYAYLRSQEDHSDEHKWATGVLLYPTVQYQLAEKIWIQGHLLRWETVDLTKPWQEIEASLVSKVTQWATTGKSLILIH